MLTCLPFRDMDNPPSGTQWVPSRPVLRYPACSIYLWLRPLIPALIGMTALLYHNPGGPITFLPSLYYSSTLSFLTNRIKPIIPIHPYHQTKDT